MLASPPYRHVLLLVAATACWGCGTVMSKQVLDRGVAPLTLLAVELTASAFLLILATMLIGVTVTSSPPWSSLPSLVC
jgi:drug/metabolite transporter (DMT)-like permease